MRLTKPFLDKSRRMMSGEEEGAPVARLIGFRITAVDKDFCAMALEVTERHANPMGTLHGGIICDIADAALGMAWASDLDEGESFTTLELKVNYLKPVWQATLVAEARVKKRGRTVGLAVCEVRDQKGDLIAYASSTLMTLRGDQARGR